MAHSAITYDIVLFKRCMLPPSLSLSSKSVFAFACCCLLGHASASWSVELILNLNSSWTCGLKSVSMYFSNDGVTQQVHMIPGVWVKRINFHSREWRKKGFPIYRKSYKNRRLGLLGSLFGASWQASWTHAPKRLDFGGVWKRPGSPRRPICLQLGGPGPSKIDARTRKSRCPKTICFWHRCARALF